MATKIPHEAHIIALCMARIPAFIDRLHSGKTQSQVFQFYTAFFGLSSSSFKRLRDEYDAFYPYRSGYKGALTRKSRMAVFNQYDCLPEETLLKVAREITENHLSSNTISNMFVDQISESAQVSRAERLKRLQNSEKLPPTISVTNQEFVRNPDVVVEALLIANGLCQHCGEPAPFLRKSNGTPYLEVHHTLPLANGGEDTIDNAVALCPNCHRKAHYG